MFMYSMFIFAFSLSKVSMLNVAKYTKNDKYSFLAKLVGGTLVADVYEHVLKQ